MNKLIFFSLLPVLMLMVPNVSASVSQELNEEQKESGFYDERGQPIENSTRAAINPEFDPDEDCNISYELKCIPGSQQNCRDIEGYHNGEDNVCSPIKCQDGYHSVDEVETGLCYPNEGGCQEDNMILIEDTLVGMRCAYLSLICDDEEFRNEDYCIEWRTR
jgi:hypothetical protein